MARGIYIRTKFVESSARAFICSLNLFNNASNDYRAESSLILIANAIELVSKSIILRKGGKIEDPDDEEKTISAEKSLWLLFDNYKVISDLEHKAMQQIISLRNEAIHNVLPDIEMDVLHYLLFSAYKLYRKFIEEYFSSHKNLFKKSFLSISTEQNITYADRIEGLLRSSKKSDSQRRLLYLLERGVAYKGANYISQNDFEQKFKKQKNKRLINRSELGEYISTADLLKVVFIQAPKNHTINIDIAKGKKVQKEALPVFTKITDINKDYPYLLSTLSEKLHKGRNIILKVINDEKLKGNEKYHQEIKTGKRSVTHKYSDSAFQYISSKLS